MDNYEPGPKDIIEASIVKDFNSMVLRTQFGVQATILVGGAAMYGIKGACIGALANTVDFAVRFGKTPSELMEGRRDFIERNWEALKDMSQFKWIVAQIESGNSPVRNDGSLSLLSTDAWPEALKKDLKQSAIVTGVKITLPGRLYRGLQLIRGKGLRPA